MSNSTTNKMATWKKVLIGIVIFIVISNIIGSLNSKSDNGKAVSRADEENSVEASNSLNEAVAESNWEYTEEKDKMSGKVKYYATCTSTNKIDFEFPYNGGSSFFLTVRNQGKGQEVLLSVSKGQFIGGIGFDGSITVKFDDGAPVKYAFGASSDGSADVIFISDEKRFLSKLKKASKLMIEAEFYQAGNKIIEFDVAGFEWDK